MRKPKLLIAASAAVFAAATCPARTFTLNAPSASPYADTERAATHPIPPFEPHARDLRITVDPQAFANAEVWFGTAANAEFGLRREEVDLRLVYESGAWLAINERDGIRTAFPDESPFFAFNLSPRQDGVVQANGLFFSRAWTHVKLVTRGACGALIESALPSDTNTPNPDTSGREASMRPPLVTLKTILAPLVITFR